MKHGTGLPSGNFDLPFYLTCCRLTRASRLRALALSTNRLPSTVVVLPRGRCGRSKAANLAGAPAS